MYRMTPGQRFKPDSVSDEDWRKHLDGYGRTNAFVSRVSENMWCVRPSDEFVFLYVDINELIVIMEGLKVGTMMPKPEKAKSQSIEMSEELADILRGI